MTIFSGTSAKTYHCSIATHETHQAHRQPTNAHQLKMATTPHQFGIFILTWFLRLSSLLCNLYRSFWECIEFPFSRCDSMAFLIILTAIVWASLLYGYVSYHNINAKILKMPAPHWAPLIIFFQFLTMYARSWHFLQFLLGLETSVGPFHGTDCDASNQCYLRQVFGNIKFNNEHQV